MSVSCKFKVDYGLRTFAGLLASRGRRKAGKASQENDRPNYAVMLACSAWAPRSFVVVLEGRLCNPFLQRMKHDFLPSHKEPFLEASWKAFRRNLEIK